MKYAEYINSLRRATTAAELEALNQLGSQVACRGRSWASIRKVRYLKALDICASHPLAYFVPRILNRKLTVCGESYKIGRGYNAAGVRYAWLAAEEFAKDALMRNGISAVAATEIWTWADSYPHLCLEIIEQALAGKLPDPAMNTLILSEYEADSPLRLTAEGNACDEIDRRATLPCGCGGTLFDWGLDFDGTFTLVNWRCNGCRNVYIEYVTSERLEEIRRPH